jgi:hypothetical protein
MGVVLYDTFLYVAGQQKRNIMNNYAMIYENLVLNAFGETWRRDDPFGLGDADEWSSMSNELTYENSHRMKFGLSAALKLAARKHQNKSEITDQLEGIDKKVWDAQTYNDACKVLMEANVLLEELKKQQN